MSRSWLVRWLNKHNWIIRREQGAEMAEKLGLTPHHAGLYRNIHPWLPDVRWGKTCMPCCPTCHSNKEVGSQGFNSSHYGRMVVGLKENYYVLTRRYRCLGCDRKNDELAKVAKAASGPSAQVTLTLRDKLDLLQYILERRRQY